MNAKQNRPPVKSRTMFAVATLLIVVLAGSVFAFLAASQKLSKEATFRNSEFYMQQLTMQTISHFESNIKSREQQGKLIAESLSAKDLSSVANLQSYILNEKTANTFDFFAFLGSDGTIYTSTASYPGISKIKSLSTIIKSHEMTLSLNQALLNTNMVLFSVPIQHQPLEDTTLVAELIGLSMNTVQEELTLQNDYADTYSSVIQANGDYLIFTQVQGLGSNSNAFSYLESSAVFDKGYSLEKMREDIWTNTEGISVFQASGKTYYIYYHPIRGTEWNMITVMPYEAIGKNVDYLSHNLAIYSGLLLAVIVVLIGIVFAAYVLSRIRVVAALEKAKKEAEAASVAKGSFMSSMSHEIRTPLNAVIGYMSIAQGEKIQNEKVQHCLENAELAAKHLLSIINDVLDMSSIESGKIKIAKVDYNLKQQLSTISTIFYNQAARKDVDFSTNLKGLTEEWVVGDELRVNQIIMNLLSNAVKFTPEHGRVTLEVEQLERTEERVVIRFGVRDTGVGMTKEYLSRIFTPFEQESAGTAKRFGGTGLGLSISKNLCTLMGGTIQVQSEQNVGSTFTVEMPFGISKKSAGHNAETVDFSKIRVLLVDDVEDELTYIKQILKRIGVKADGYTDGEKAVRRFTGRQNTEYAYNLCIIDWKMPNCNGIDVAKEIRKVGNTDVPILIATAYDVTEIDDEAKAAGVNRVLAKPLFQSSLMDLLVETFGKYEPQNAQGGSQGIDLHGARTLLAEDNEMNMEIAVNILTKAGLVVEQAENGKVALDKFLASKPGEYDLILMDVQMPVMDGYTATKTIRASNHPQAKTIPIIAMTANAFTQDVEDALASGMNAHIAKPIDYGKLYMTLNDCLHVEKPQQ